MPRCPQCQEEASRRKNDACPNCGIPVELKDGAWFLIGQSAPNIELLKYWERLMTGRIGEQFHIPRKDPRYLREAKFAHDLMRQAEGDLELAKKTMWLLFNDRDFSWKTYTSLLHMTNDWLPAMIMARPILTEERRREQSSRRQFEELQNSGYGLPLDTD